MFNVDCTCTGIEALGAISDCFGCSVDLVVRAAENKLFMSKPVLTQMKVDAFSKQKRIVMLVRAINVTSRATNLNFVHSDLCISALDVSACFNTHELPIGPSVLIPLTKDIRCPYYAMV